MVGSGFFIFDELDGFVVDLDVDPFRGSNQIQDDGLAAFRLDDVLCIVLSVDVASDFFIHAQLGYFRELQFGGHLRNVVADDFGINIAPVVVVEGDELVFAVGLVIIRIITVEGIFAGNRSFFLSGSLFSGSLFSGSFFIIIIGRNRITFRFRSKSFFLDGGFFHYSVFFLSGSFVRGGSFFLGGFFLCRNLFLYNRKFFLGSSSFLCNLFNLHRFTVHHGSFDRFFCKGQRTGKQQRYSCQQGENFLKPIHHDPYLTLVVLVCSSVLDSVLSILCPPLHKSYIREDSGVSIYLKMGIRIH